MIPLISELVLGFSLPWVYGVYLLRKHRSIFLHIYPVGVAVAMTVNSIGFILGYWMMYPTIDHGPCRP